MMKYGDKKVYLYSFLFCFSSVIVSIALIIQPLLLKKMFDNYKNINMMKQSVMLYGISILLIIVFEYLTKLSTVEISIGIKDSLRKSISNTIQKNRYTNITKEKQAELNVDLNTNIDAFIEEYFLNILNIIMIFLSLIFYGVAIFSLDTLMVIIIFVPNFISLLIPKIFSKKVSEKRKILIERNERYNLTFFDFYSGINILKNLLAVSYWRNKLDKVSNESINAEKDFGIFQSFIESAIGFISFMGSLILIGYGVYRVGTGYMTIGTLVASFQFSELIVVPIINLSVSLNMLTSGKEVKKKLDSRYRQSSTITKLYPEKKSCQFESIIFRDFSFSYDSTPMIDIESCIIKKGDKVLITGKNGCGKSTLMKLITKEVEGYNGELLINDVELKKIPLNKINEIFGILTPRDHIFNSTIEDNIKLGMNIDIKEFKDILSLVRYDEILKNDKTSQSLSGGERQRISFLRTIIRNKDVLIIDEAFNQVQKDIRIDIIKWLCKNRDLTLFYISHDNEEISEYFNVNIKFKDKKIYVNKRDKYVQSL